jgi:hypothetical protein
LVQELTGHCGSSHNSTEYETVKGNDKLPEFLWADIDDFQDKQSEMQLESNGQSEALTVSQHMID